MDSHVIASSFLSLFHFLLVSLPFLSFNLFVVLFLSISLSPLRVILSFFVLFPFSSSLPLQSYRLISNARRGDPKETAGKLIAFPRKLDSIQSMVRWVDSKEISQLTHLTRSLSHLCLERRPREDYGKRIASFSRSKSPRRRRTWHRAPILTLPICMRRTRSLAEDRERMWTRDNQPEREKGKKRGVGAVETVT